MVRSKKIAGLVLAAGLAAGGLTASTGRRGVRRVVDLRRFRRGDHGHREAGRRGDVPDPVPVRHLERDAVPVQPRLRGPGSKTNPAQDAGNPVTAAWMLGHGYALAGSSYASTGWAIAHALPDQIGTLDTFGSLYGKPRTTVAWGHSLGGIITAGLIQDYPNRFNAALPMCGVLSGGVATWNTALDAEFAFQKLIDPAVQIVNITNPAANLQAAEVAGAQAQADPAGPGPPRPGLGARRHARLVHPAVPRTRRHRLRRPGGEPVPVGFAGDLPVRLRLPGRTRGQGRR